MRRAPRGHRSVLDGLRTAMRMLRHGARAMRFALAITAALVGSSLLTTPAAAQAVHPELAPLERLIGGRWYMGDDTYHSFSWGVGSESIIASSFWLRPEGERLVAQSTFFYHPGEEMVKGFAVARDMGIAVFEYEVRARGDTIVLDLKAFGPAAGDAAQQETWVFTDDDHYLWTLYEEVDGAWERQMGGTFERRRSPSGPPAPAADPGSRS